MASESKATGSLLPGLSALFLTSQCGRPTRHRPQQATYVSILVPSLKAESVASQGKEKDRCQAHYFLCKGFIVWTQRSFREGQNQRRLDVANLTH